MNCNGKFLRVWEVEDKGNYKKVNLGDSIKQKDGTYKNFTWFNVAFVGNANIELREKDVIEIKSGQISMNKSEKNGQWYPNLVVFECEVTERKTADTKDFVEDSGFIDFEDDDVPWT